MPLLTREAILTINDIKTETVEVLEWGGSVLVKALSGSERDAFEAEIVEMRGKHRVFHLENARARLCSLAIVDENGKRLFGDVDVQALGKKSAAALSRVFDVAQRLAGITDEDLEDLAKNSESAPSGASTSA